MAQRLLQLTLHTRTALVTSDTVCSALGVDAETLSAKVDAGELRWVWDVSVQRQRIRELRFLAAELTEARAYASLDLILREILPAQRDRLRSGEVAQLLRVSDPHILRLVNNGELHGDLIGHSRQVRTASLRHFLTQRLLAAEPAR